MKKVKIIIPIVVILIFCLIYFIIYPIYNDNKKTKDIFNQFEKGLTNLNISYQKKSLTNKFASKGAYHYISEEKELGLYVYNKNSNTYKTGLSNGYIEMKNERLYGIFMNNCVLFIEEGYPSSEDIINLFEEISKYNI